MGSRTRGEVLGRAPPGSLRGPLRTLKAAQQGITGVKDVLAPGVKDVVATNTLARPGPRLPAALEARCWRLRVKPSPLKNSKGYR